MAAVNYVAQLNEYVQKSRSDIKYEDIGSDGPAHIKTFTQRVVLNGHPYPVGAGKNKKEARQNAAKHVLNDLESSQVSSPDSGLPESQSDKPIYLTKITQPNYICWLNEESQRTRVTLQAEEFLLTDQGLATASCRFVLDGRAYPTACGRNKKDAKEEAAKLVYKALFSDLPSKDLDESGNAESSSPPRSEFSQLTSQNSKVVEQLETSITKQRRPLTEPNYIGIINHYCQKTSRSLDFSMVKRAGLAHCPQFSYKVVIGGKDYPEVEGRTAKEAKQSAAQAAWTALQEQSDWDSKVSVKSAVSEEEATSSTVPTERESGNTTSSYKIVFKDSSEPPKVTAKEEKSDVKPRIKLAPIFPNASNERRKEDETPNLKIQNRPTENTAQSVTTVSRFLSDFDQIEPLGKGGFGRVFMARQKLLSENYAIKIVRQRPKALREAKVLATLEHPNIVRYFNVWCEQSGYNNSAGDSSSTSQSSTDSSVPYLYIQMELCGKKTLKVWIDERNVMRRDPTRREESQDIMLKIMCAVEYIHHRNLIHRDLKPSNIMFALKGEVKIGDFGLATEDSDDDTLERTRSAGTRSFMAPEQRSTSVYGRKVDIFALGLVYFMMLWPMLTGQEKEITWRDIRLRKFPSDFAQKFHKEKDIIDLMLHDSPEFRPHAKDVLDKLRGSDVLQPSSESSSEKRGPQTV